MKNLIIVSKPIQFINVFNYLSQEGAGPGYELFVINKFFGAESLALRVKQNTDLDNVICRPTYWHLVPYLLNRKVQKLFLDSDIGFKNRLLILMASASNVSVFEEGIGTYNIQGFGPKNVFKSYIGEFYGTDKLLVYKPEKVAKKIKGKSEKITQPLQEYLTSNFDYLSKIMLNDSYDKRLENIKDEVNVYFTSWKIDHDFLKSFKGEILLRYHPHIKKEQHVYSNIKLNKYYLGELDIMGLLLKEDIKLVNIYSHGTSTQFYLKSKKLNFVNI